MKTIKVMVVDDSSFMRKVVSDLLNSDPEIEVIATARDGLDAWDKLRNLDPDVTVSYTHLDVYKRQVCLLSRIKLRNPLLFLDLNNCIRCV